MNVSDILKKSREEKQTIAIIDKKVGIV